MKKVLVFMADGCEEIEALTVVDLLRRAGVQVDMVSVSNEETVTGAHNIKFDSDIAINKIDRDGYDAYVLPGGNPGFKNLAKSNTVREITVNAADSGKLVAAICAAPTVLGDFGLLKGKKASCYPGMEGGMIGSKANEEAVNIDGNIITSRGLGTAIEFSLAIVEYLVDKDASKNLAESIVWKRP